MVGPGSRLKRRPNRRRATAAVELALTLPLIVSLLAGLYESARIIEVGQILTNAAREGARQAGTGQYTNSQVQTIVQQYLQIALNDSSGTITGQATITVQDLTSPGTDVSAATSLDSLQVTVTVPYSAVAWTSLTFVTNSSTQVTGQATWVSCVDVAYPSTTPQPPTG